MYSKPFKGEFRMSSPYGTRTLNGVEHFHTGIDYAMPENTPLYCCDGGVVTFSGTDQYGGKYIDIKADSDGGSTRYLHLNRIDVAKGERVVTGQMVGVSGNTGWSTGPHLHLEFVTAVNPSKAHINPNTGAFDPKYWAEPTEFINGEYKPGDNTGGDPTETTRIQGNYKQYQVQVGIWRSEVIQEIINHGLWTGTWQANEPRFFELNGTITPQGGFQPGTWVNYDVVIQEMSGVDVIENDFKQAEMEDTAMQEQKEIIQESSNVVEQPLDKHKSVAGDEGQTVRVKLPTGEEFITTLEEASKLYNKKDHLSAEQWALGWIKFGIDKWAMISSVLVACATWIDQYIPEEYTFLFYGAIFAVSFTILVYFLTNKLIDKWKK